MSLDNENTNWMIRIGRILSRLFFVLFVVLILIWITAGNGLERFAFFLLGALFSILWSHSVEMSERVLNLEEELWKMKKQYSSSAKTINE